ncbi:MAG: rubrerythrin, partial [Alphaproteobacteria bacterium]|nr:rubrerythrin [Alphaproteobacteria bacterium]
MTVSTVYKQGWTMDDVHWNLFDSTKVEPNLLAAVKAAALVEYNAPDYVSYLKRVFHETEP